MPTSRMALITFLDGGTGPDNTLPGGNWGRPDNSLPGGQGGRPDQGLPPGAVNLPVFPFDPTIDNSLPGQQPGPDQGLPRPGKKFVVKWLACHGLILVPDNSLPSGPPLTPNQGLPGDQPGMGNELPSGPPNRPGQGLPETPSPKLYGG